MIHLRGREGALHSAAGQALHRHPHQTRRRMILSNY